MVLTTSPIGSLQNQDDGVLDASITASATSLTISPIKKWVAGVLTTGGFNTTAGFCKIIDSSGRYEFISFDSNSVNATTNITTLTGIRRGLSVTASGYGAGTGLTFDANSRIYVTDYAGMWQTLVNLDVAQSISAVKTFTGSGAVRGSSTTVPLLRSNSMTTAQKNASSAANGDEVYDSDLGQKYDFVSGAWTARSTGTFSNAANGTGGKVDLATAAEVAAGTATDGVSGSPNVIPVSIVKPTSTGAVSGSVPAFNTAVMLDGSIGGTGVASPVLGALLIGGGAGLAMTPIGPGTTQQVPVSNGTTLAMGTPTSTAPRAVLVSGASSATLTNPTVDTAFDTNVTTITSSTLIANVGYEFEYAFTTNVAAGGLQLGVMLGSTLLTSTALSGTPNDMSIRGVLIGTAAAGASVAVRCVISGMTDATPGVGRSIYATTNVATNGSLVMAPSAKFDSSNGGNTVTCTMARVIKISTTAF